MTIQISHCGHSRSGQGHLAIVFFLFRLSCLLPTPNQLCRLDRLGAGLVLDLTIRSLNYHTLTYEQREAPPSEVFNQFEVCQRHTWK